MTGPTEYFRAGAGIVVSDGKGRVLAFERRDGHGRWQLPQGGIETGEAPVDAAYRELLEETGLHPGDVELVDEVPEWLVYELPPELRSDRTGRGQAQKWFIFQLGDRSLEPTLSGGPGAPSEFAAWKWITMADLAAEVVEFRRAVYSRILHALPAPE